MNSILIVDDTAFTRLVLRNMFEKLGVEVVAEADSGEEAVRNYCLYRPSLVIMDITMPGMNGLVASRKIMELDKNAKIIICSAVTRRDTVIKAIRQVRVILSQNPCSSRELNGLCNIYWKRIPGECDGGYGAVPEFAVGSGTAFDQ